MKATLYNALKDIGAGVVLEFESHAKLKSAYRWIKANRPDLLTQEKKECKYKLIVKKG